MPGLVALDGRGLALGDLLHLHRRDVRIVLAGDGLEDRLQRLVHSVGGTGDGVGVGEVGGDGAHAHRLRLQRGAGDVEDRQVAHGLLPRDRGQHGTHLALDEAERGAVLERGTAIGGTLGIRVDGVAVQAGLYALARDLERVQATTDLVVLFVGGGHQAVGILPLGVAQGGVEVQVLGLVAGRIGIAEVAGDQLHPLR
ncbi:hypothetical protein G6F68_010748 [Rhizopus microsporus]|nr:hypothetical protein G6F68_010748 [Rhizopus microsporus]